MKHFILLLYFFASSLSGMEESKKTLGMELYEKWQKQKESQDDLEKDKKKALFYLIELSLIDPKLFSKNESTIYSNDPNHSDK